MVPAASAPTRAIGQSKATLKRLFCTARKTRVTSRAFRAGKPQHHCPTTGPLTWHSNYREYALPYHDNLRPSPWGEFCGFATHCVVFMLGLRAALNSIRISWSWTRCIFRSQRD